MRGISFINLEKSTCKYWSVVVDFKKRMVYNDRPFARKEIRNQICGTVLWRQEESPQGKEVEFLWKKS